MNATCQKIRADILSISHSSGHGHIPTCFSVVEALYAVYRTLRHRPTEPQWAERDLFVLSKGHAALGHYCTLAAFGYFPVAEVGAFGAFGSLFGCHADRFKVPGIEASTGSLGHGIGIAVGMALGLKIQRSARRVVTLVGDGEANEGTVWEAVLVAVDQKLSGLTILYDHNKSQRRCLQIPNPADRFRAFGCAVTEVSGHDLDQLEQALSSFVADKPHVIVADTVKGFGCQTLCDEVFAWHRRSPDSVTLAQLMEELYAG
ncbi:MAG: transketolase [Magnetococcales bacterium]|nr:transketolase [Magnetococcales bacterium]